MSLITDNDAVAAFCARQKGAQFVAIDTEFMRERTYWPILCVVQVAGPEEAVAIDALTEGIDCTSAAVFGHRATAEGKGSSYHFT